MRHSVKIPKSTQDMTTSKSTFDEHKSSNLEFEADSFPEVEIVTYDNRKYSFKGNDNDLGI